MYTSHRRFNVLCLLGGKPISFTPDRWQSKTLLTIDERGSKPIEAMFSIASRRQMAIQNSVSNYFLSTLVDSTNVLDCRISCVSFIIEHVKGGISSKRPSFNPSSILTELFLEALLTSRPLTKLST